MKKYIIPEITVCVYKANASIADIYDSTNASSIGKDPFWDPEQED